MSPTPARRRPGPKTAERMARETGKAVVDSQGTIQTGISREEEVRNGRYVIVKELATLVGELPGPEDVTVPDYAPQTFDAARTVLAWLSRFLEYNGEPPQ